MPPFARAGAGERGAGGAARRVQSRHQIGRQERAVARHACHPFALRRMRRRPIEPGENAGKRPGKIRHAIGHDRQTGIGKAGRVAVGVDHKARALRRHASEHPLQDSDAADRDACLVAAAHAARQAAGEHQAESGGIGHSK